MVKAKERRDVVFSSYNFYRSAENVSSKYFLIRVNTFLVYTGQKLERSKNFYAASFMSN